MRALSDRPVLGRFTLLYGLLFFASGAVLLAVVNAVALGTSPRVESEPVPSMPTARPLEEAALLRERLAEAGADQHRALLLGSLVALGLLALVSVLLGRVAAGRALAPLRAITAATRRVSADTLHERLAVTGPRDEVKELADTIDGLLARLEEAFAAQRRFVADASHELRTPLTTIRATLDVASAKPAVSEQTLALAGRVRAELDSTDDLLNGLLVLAQAQHRALEAPAQTDLATEAARSLAARAPALDAHTLTTSLDPAPARGDTALLARLVDNLIDNAATHTPQGGTIRVTTAQEAGISRLTVETDGPHLTQSEVDTLARPFRRLGPARTGPGSGLGLAIVSAVATAHGGTLTLTPRPEGGLHTTVTLPSGETP
ncbi:HAMP domain-containing sensor histidine kinase [Actinocorallia sp. A-T 12471]|uniref:sensor histidine kinase n=1 Tax=Actinocorallia sp. A-T 12471 TaxID=3089813 RepID=UPI0029CDB77B|nr:HAMP domain-containing sensor histidine kinase [Actinocorallia sp. A-T 12471]MDX6743694.1 HAMP domain-containing sensor histidine kinase [Actinocorallia sp. A-T 12471]